jgi:hypothetical protein
MWHRVSSDFHQFRSSLSSVTKCVQTDMTYDDVSLGLVRLNDRLGQFLEANAEKYLKIDNDRFLPRPILCTSFTITAIQCKTRSVSVFLFVC